MASSAAAASCSPPAPQNLIPKSQSLGPLAWEQSNQQDLWPSLAKKHKMVRQGGQATGDGQEFSTNLFFSRLRSFDSSTPQQSCHLPPPPPPAPPPSLLLAITHGDLTPSAPSAPHSRGPWAIGQEQAQGRHLCAGHRMRGGGGVGKEGRSSPPPPGSATVLFLILQRLKCNDGPPPSFAEGSLPPATARLWGQADRAQGPSWKGPQWLLPTFLGTKYI